MNQHLFLVLGLLFLACPLCVIFNQDHFLVAYLMILKVSCISSSQYCELFGHIGHGWWFTLGAAFCNFTDISVRKLFIPYG